VGAREANDRTVTERAFADAQRVLPLVSALETAVRVCAAPLAECGGTRAASAYSD
jgi:hypothetical protein